MLSAADRTRLALKRLEFCLPDSLQKFSHSAGLVRSPYRPKHDELQAIFIHVPKAAGTSLRRALYDSKSFHIPAVRYKTADPEKFSSYFKFCFVRNPWDRLQSAFHYLHRRVGADPAYPDHRWANEMLGEVDDFPKFVKKLENEYRFRHDIRSYIHFRDQLDWISGKGSTGRETLMDYVGYYESLEKDCALIASRLKIELDLPHERKLSYGRDFRFSYTSSHMVDAVADLYSEDINAFGYTFE